MQTFAVWGGTSGEVARVADRKNWRPWTTTKRLEFSEPVSRTRTMVTFRRGHWLLRVKILNVQMDRSPRPPDQSLEVLKQYADDPLLETSVSREMVSSWTKRQAANVKKRDEQLSDIEASGPFGF